MGTEGWLKGLPWEEIGTEMGNAKSSIANYAIGITSSLRSSQSISKEEQGNRSG
jgi:hypothetical protein